MLASSPVFVISQEHQFALPKDMMRAQRKLQLPVIRYRLNPPLHYPAPQTPSKPKPNGERQTFLFTPRMETLLASLRFEIPGDR